jgi:hypothetical protein
MKLRALLAASLALLSATCGQHARSLGANFDVVTADGAMLELNFKWQMNIRKLAFDGKLQPPGTYAATSAPASLQGTGALNVRP